MASDERQTIKQRLNDIIIRMIHDSRWAVTWLFSSVAERPWFPAAAGLPGEGLRLCREVSWARTLALRSLFSSISSDRAILALC